MRSQGLSALRNAAQGTLPYQAQGPAARLRVFPLCGLCTQLLIGSVLEGRQRKTTPTLSCISAATAQSQELPLLPGTPEKGAHTAGSTRIVFHLQVVV